MLSCKILYKHLHPVKIMIQHWTSELANTDYTGSYFLLSSHNIFSIFKNLGVRFPLAQKSMTTTQGRPS